MPIPNSVKQQMMKAILGIRKLIQFSVNLMSHIMQIVCLSLFFFLSSQHFVYAVCMCVLTLSFSAARNEQEEMEEKREIKRRLTRKVSPK